MKQDEALFSAPWGRQVKSATVWGAGVLGTLAALPWLLGAAGVPALVASLAPLCILAGGAMSGVRRYDALPDFIVIHRFGWTTRLARFGLQRVEVVPGVMQGSLRGFGNGGLFALVEGLVSLTDVISSIVGDLPTEAGEEPSIVRREDGSWLLDGALDLDTVLRTLDAETVFSDEDRQHYHTLGGFAMLGLGRVPRIGDVFEKGGYRFEIVDMDGNRVDRVLVGAIGRGNPASDEL